MLPIQPFLSVTTDPLPPLPQFALVSWSTVLFGACCFVTLYIFQFPMKKHLPDKLKLLANMGPLLVVIVSLIIVGQMGVDKKVAKTVANTGGKEGIRIVGQICAESGFACLPSPRWPFSIQFCDEESQTTPQMMGTCKSDGADGHTEVRQQHEIPIRDTQATVPDRSLTGVPYLRLRPPPIRGHRSH